MAGAMRMMTYLLLLTAVLCAGVVGACDQLLVGHLTEHRLARYNGIYIRFHGPAASIQPVYKHESKRLYLYAIRENSDVRNFVFSRQPGRRNRLDIMIETSAPSPELATEVWAARNFSPIGGYWQALDARFRVVCVSDNTRTCSDGEDIVIEDPRPHSNMVPKLGRYEKQPGLIHERSYYRKVDGHAFLFCVTPGIWLIGPEAGRSRGSVLVRDFAYRAEHITGRWLVGTQRSGFRQAVNVRVRCVDPGNLPDAHV